MLEKQVGVGTCGVETHWEKERKHWKAEKKKKKKSVFLESQRGPRSICDITASVLLSLF